MRLIDKLILKDIIGPFLSGLMMFMLLVFTAGSLFQATDMLVKGVPPWTVFKFVMLTMPSIITQTFPMAMLLGGLLAFGRLSADREAVAIFAAGISFPRTLRIVLLVGLIVSITAFLWNDIVVPPASSAMWVVKQEAMEHFAESTNTLSYSFEGKDGQEEFVRVDGGYDARTQSYKRVSIIKYSADKKHKGEPEIVIYCNTAKAKDLKSLNWTYYDGWSMPFIPDKSTGTIDNLMPLYFKETKTLPHEVTLGKSFDEGKMAEVTDPNNKSFKNLQQEIAAERKKGRDVRGLEVDLYGKIALPFASLIFGVVGSALGLNTQRGGGKSVGFGLAIFIVFIYWVFYHSTFVVGKSGGLPPMLASFMADIVGAVVGMILAIRASK